MSDIFFRTAGSRENLFAHVSRVVKRDIPWIR